MQLNPACQTFTLPASFLVPARLEQEELFDLGVGSAGDAARNLAEMQRINDRLGGTRALFRHLLPRLLNHAGPVTLLDVGTGMAGLPAALLAWSQEKGTHLRVFAIDRSPRSLDAAQRSAPGVGLVQADARGLPFPPCGVDYVISSLVMHHFDPPDLMGLLRRSFEMARRGVVMSDLVRGWLPWVAYQAVQPVFARSFLTRHDGLLSIRRAYTPRELFGLAQEAGLPNPRVYAHWPWRMTLVVEK